MTSVQDTEPILDHQQDNNDDDNIDINLLYPPGSFPPQATLGPRPRRVSRRSRTTSTSSTLQAAFSEVERFGRRTISVSGNSDIDVAPIIATTSLEDNVRHPETSTSEESVTSAESHPISDTETIIHLLKGNIGMGILTLPLAIKNSGLIAGSVGLALIATICVYCMHMLVRSSHKAKAKRDLRFMDYADTAEASFKDAGWRKYATSIRRLINIFLCLSQIGSNAVYALFMANNIQPMLAHYGGDFFKDLNYRYYILMWLIPIILICCIRNLKYLSPCSVLANILQFVGIGIIFYYIFREPLPSSNSLPWLADMDRLPLFFGTAIFAIEGISVVLPIENQMKTPGNMLGFAGVLNTAMISTTCLYIAMGFFGYLKYGEAILSSITLNLPPQEILGTIVLCLFSISIYFSYALQFYVLMEILNNNFLKPRFEGWTLLGVDFLLRLVLNVITLGLAASVPWLDLLVSLLGAVKMSTLSLMAPAVIDTASNWADLGRFRWRLVKNILIFLFGLFGCCVGTYTSLLDIIHNFQK